VTGKIPQNQSKFMFIRLTKKLDALETTIMVIAINTVICFAILLNIHTKEREVTSGLYIMNHS
jgi:hypothetical protein